MYVTAIVLAAGKGLRLKSRIPKPLIEINSCPLIIYSLNTLSEHPGIRDIIVVANPENLRAIVRTIKQYGIRKMRGVVLGGKQRQDSVRNGLKAIANRAESILVHDAARPFIDKKIVSAVIKEAKISQAAIAGVPVKSTIKRVTERGFVKETIQRNNLWEIQTPQVFKKDLILKAYQRFGKADVTDDAMLAERSGAKVSVVLGSYNNIKITTPEDLMLAEIIAKQFKKGYRP